MFDSLCLMSRRSDPALALEAMLASDVAGFDASAAVEALGDVRTVRGLVDRYEASVTSRLAHVHADGGGAPAADVHTKESGVSAAEARRKERRAKTLDAVESFGDALATGAIGAEHVDALANVTGKLDDEVKAELLDREHDLLADAIRQTPEAFGRRCRELVNRIERDQGVERAERQRRETRLSRRVDQNGMHHLTGVFHPELGAAIWSAIDSQVGALVAATGDRSTDREQLAAEALGELISGGHQAERPTVTEVGVLIDLATLTHGLHEHSICEYDNGVPLPPATVRRLCCNAEVIPIVLKGDGVPVDVGRDQRLANRAQRRALRAMYRTCAFHGCDVPFRRCEIHHLLEWELGGPTDLANLLPLCARHHHVIHEGGWQLDWRRTAPSRSDNPTVRCMRKSASTPGRPIAPPCHDLADDNPTTRTMSPSPAEGSIGAPCRPVRSHSGRWIGTSDGMATPSGHAPPPKQNSLPSGSSRTQLR
jgi:hypothetical protein